MSFACHVIPLFESVPASTAEYAHDVVLLTAERVERTGALKPTPAIIAAAANQQ
jgi:hypothetical protein